MLDNLLKKNPVLGVIIYPLLGLGAIWLGHYYSQSLSLLLTEPFTIGKNGWSA